jgi:DNA-binding transcriptional LysR family regulator
MQTELIGQRIKLQHLKVVMAVAEWGSMAKAAKHLAITQPVVSKVIADLEDLLGVRLFDRSPQGVKPTPYGRALLKRSITIFDDLRTSVDEIKFMADPASGELRIGSTEPILAGLGAAVMERLWRQYPHINFRVVEADSATLLNRDLPERRYSIDWGIVSNITWTWPPSRSISAGAPPRYGTWSMSMPAIILNSSPSTWSELPLPLDAKLSLPGLALA